jgi:hypothetical protein
MSAAGSASVVDSECADKGVACLKTLVCVGQFEEERRGGSQPGGFLSGGKAKGSWAAGLRVEMVLAKQNGQVLGQLHPGSLVAPELDRLTPNLSR